ncbi:MAG: T9SS type A sorting domain-containing protein, partial [Candidatus Marinimicrobia bacterium]|nr:T9SS type A sorting domain-containing protein [Candidatus Neomarinimicrobiota bacterium]
GADSFDVMGVLSFTFDELLDPSTVNETSVTLWKGTEQIEIDPVHSANEFRSNIDVRAEEPLVGGESYSLHLAPAITDTAGNALSEEVVVNFVTQLNHYAESILIDDLRGSMGTWAAPGFSGSTHGILVSESDFAYTSAVYLPASYEYSTRKKSAFLKYAWDLEYDGNAGPYLIREYLSGGAAREISFDNSYTLQCFVFGDGSLNSLRFALDEAMGDAWPNHEVSTWVKVDWEGWRLLEWDLSDPEQVGSWIGNGLLDGTAYRIDSFQFGFDEEAGDAAGQVYFDELRVVKKMGGVSIDRSLETQLPAEVSLYQNYPNPFNPETVITFDLPSQMLAQVSVFDIRGREVEVLVNTHLPAGRHTTRFNGSDYAAGVYMLVLETEMGTTAKRMLLLK